jgi:effector protein LidA
MTQSTDEPRTSSKDTPEKPQNKQEESVNPELEQRADLIYKNLDSTAISRFGIKSPSDVVTFLRSPAGDSLMAEIGKQMAIERSRQENNELQIREQELLMHRIQAALFLWSIEKQAYADEK